MTRREFWSGVKELTKGFLQALLDLYEDRECTIQDEHRKRWIKRTLKRRHFFAKVKRIGMAIKNYPRRWYNKQRREAREYKAVCHGWVTKTLLWMREKAAMIAAWALCLAAPFVAIDHIMYPRLRLQVLHLSREILEKYKDQILVLGLIMLAIALFYVVVVLPLNAIRDKTTLRNYRKSTVVFAAFSVGIVAIMYSMSNGTPVYDSFQRFFEGAAMATFWAAMGLYVITTGSLFLKRAIIVEVKEPEVEETKPDVVKVEDSGEVASSAKVTAKKQQAIA